MPTTTTDFICAATGVDILFEASLEFMAASRLRASKATFLLDIDGTLVYSDAIYFRVFQKLLAPLGYTVDDAFFKENVHGKVDADVFKKLLPADATEEDLLAISKKKDSTFCELYREQSALSGPCACFRLPNL